MTENPEFYRKTEHIELQWHWTWEKVEQNEIVIKYISTREILTDGLTKALGPKIFNNFQRMIEVLEQKVEPGWSWKVIESHRTWWKIRSQWRSMTWRWLETSRNYLFRLRLAQYFMYIRDLKSLSRQNSENYLVHSNGIHVVINVLVHSRPVIFLLNESSNTSKSKITSHPGGTRSIATRLTRGDQLRALPLGSSAGYHKKLLNLLLRK